MLKAVIVIAALVSPVTGHAQGSSGTGIRSGGWTQQPGAATNPVTGPTNLTPAQKNAIPPANARPTNAQRYSK
jgi:hypothetical protein